MYLIDTHILIWCLLDNSKLSKKVFEILNDEFNEIYVSVASLLEIELKRSKGKLELPSYRIAEAATEMGFNIINITADHIATMRELEFKHGDPFDRTLISQAKYENLKLITSDKKICEYDIKCVEN